MAATRLRIFSRSVQQELAQERAALRDYPFGEPEFAPTYGFTVTLRRKPALAFAAVGAKAAGRAAPPVAGGVTGEVEKLRLVCRSAMSRRKLPVTPPRIISFCAGLTRGLETCFTSAHNTRGSFGEAVWGRLFGAGPCCFFNVVA